jgi:L-ascorbate metabolism protein UlaG (beta-lactamase superfamily)
VAPTFPAGIKADVLAITGSSDERDKFEGMLLTSPGEYEVSGVLITGVAARLHVDEAGQNGTIYVIHAEDVVVAVLANIAPNLANQQLEAMGQVDVLLVPIGGHGLTLDAQAAAKIVSEVEPKVVIPIHYEDGTKYQMPQDKVDVFLKEIGANSSPEAKYRAIKKDLPEEMAVVVLKPEKSS